MTWDIEAGLSVARDMMRRSNHIAAAATVLMAVLPGATAAPAAPRGGTITIEPAGATGPTAGPASAFADAVSAALAEQGFTLLNDPGHSAYVAELSLTRSDVGTGSVKLPNGRGAVMPGVSAGVGAGVIIPLSRRRVETVPLRRVMLELWIRRRGQDGVIRHGAAVTVRPTGDTQGENKTIAADLSEALLRGYPGEPQGVISVP